MGKERVWNLKFEIELNNIKSHKLIVAEIGFEIGLGCLIVLWNSGHARARDVELFERLQYAYIYTSKKQRDETASDKQTRLPRPRVSRFL